MDALRTLAVLGMMAAHTSRLIVFEARPPWSRWVLLLEPLIPSLFLLLVGLSLARSLDAARADNRSSGAWYARQLKRAAVLWAISAVFFSLELGFRFPDALTASGILANIAYAIVIVGGLSILPRRDIAIASAFAVGAGVFVWLDVSGHRVFPLNIGNSPFLPLWLFALAGALWGTVFGSRSSGRAIHGRQEGQHSLPVRSPKANEPSPLRIVGGMLGIIVGLIGIGLIARYGVDALFTKPFGRSDAGRLTAAPFYGGEPLHVAYYNLRPLLAATCLGLQLLALVLLGKAFGRMREGAASLVFALGRHALGAYILHLALLAVLVVAIGPRPLTTAGQGTAVWTGVAIICVIWAVWREKNNGRWKVEGRGN